MSKKHPVSTQPAAVAAPVEMVDYLDESGNVVATAPRSQRTEGLLRHVFHGWVYHAATDRLVLQQRALDRSHAPGLYDISAGGVYLAGEHGLDGLREFVEELGWQPDGDSVIRLGRLLTGRPGALKPMAWCEIFLVLDPRPLELYLPDPAEVMGVGLVDRRSLLDIGISGHGTLAITMADGSVRQLSPADLSPQEPCYWQELKRMVAPYVKE